MIPRSAAEAFDDLVASHTFQRVLDTREQLWREWEEDQRRAQELLAPRGWLLSPSLHADAAKVLLAFAESHTMEEVERVLLLDFAPPTCRDIVNRLFDRDSFLKWRDTLEEALWAHTQGRFRRHQLLHGAVPQIGAERESVQGILLLEVVHSCLHFRDEVGQIGDDSPAA